MDKHASIPKKGIEGELLIRDALRIGAIELIPDGHNLANGRTFPYLLDSRLFNMLALAHVGAYNKTRPDVIFAPADKISTLSMVFGGDVEYASMRRPGGDNFLTGAPVAEKKVLIVNHIADGVFEKEAMRLVKEHGGIPVGLSIAFDGMERGAGKFTVAQEFALEHSIPVHSSANIDDLISVLRKSNGTPENVLMYQKFLAYRSENNGAPNVWATM